MYCIEIVSGNVDFFFSARFTSEKNELINFSSHNLSVKDNHLNVCHFKNSTIGFVVSLSFWIFSQSVDAKIFFFSKIRQNSTQKNEGHSDLCFNVWSFSQKLQLVSANFMFWHVSKIYVYSFSIWRWILEMLPFG